MVATALVNAPFTALASLHWQLLFPVYALISFWHLFKAPWNMPILWLTLLGLFHWSFLVLAILAKFPVGNPAPFRKTWAWVLHAMPYRNSWFYYTTIAIVWTIVLGERLR